MNLHQVITGACNAGDKCFAVGSVEGVPFTAYAAGCNIVILASNFNRVQIIPGAIHDYVPVKAIDCSDDTGKIAAGYNNLIFIYEPTPMVNVPTSNHNLDYRWIKTARIECEDVVVALSWNLEGTRLLSASNVIELWHHVHPVETKVKFTVGDSEIDDINRNVELKEIKDKINVEQRVPKMIFMGEWQLVWRTTVPFPILHVAFSCDGTLFATCGQNDRFVKVWYENKHVILIKKRAAERKKLKDEEERRKRDLKEKIKLDRNSVNLNEQNDEFLFKEIEEIQGKVQIETEVIEHKSKLIRSNTYEPNSVITTAMDALSTLLDNHTSMDKFHQLTYRDNESDTKTETDNDSESESDDQSINKKVVKNRKNSKKDKNKNKKLRPFDNKEHYNFLYLTHPTSVTHFSWRNTSKHMPKGSVSNMLITSCKDNICRLWIETVLPDNGLINLAQLDPQGADPKFRTNRHKHRFLQRLKHIKTCFHLRRQRRQLNGYLFGSPPIPSLPSTFSFHDFHSYGFHCTGVKPGLHFHLASSINAETDIPLVPNIQNCEVKPMFVLHWLNNKEMYFTQHAEIVLEDITKKILNNDGDFDVDAFAEISGLEGLDTKIEVLLRDWHHSSDLLFSIYPVDGSLLIWTVNWLDEYYPGSFRQGKISFSTRIPNAFPLGDSLSMSTNVSLYSAAPSLRHIVTDKSKDNGDQCLTSLIQLDENKYATPIVSLVTKHDNGTLNLWHLTFADDSKYSHVLNISHTKRASGHRFRVNDITCHPVLPLLLTTSHHNLLQEDGEESSDEQNVEDEQKSNKETNKDNSYSDTDTDSDEVEENKFLSELILWRVESVGPLSKSGGLCELARINSPNKSAFSSVAWLPTLLPSSVLGNFSDSPSACFVASNGESLCVYLAVIDAKSLLADYNIKKRKDDKSDSSTSLSGASSSNEPCLLDNLKIVSQQSTSRPGCIIELETIDKAIVWQNTLFLHVYQEQLITGRPNSRKSNLNSHDAIVDLQQNHIFKQPFYIVLLEKMNTSTIIHMWEIVIASTENDFDFDFDDKDTDSVEETFRKYSLNNFGDKKSILRIKSRRNCKQVLKLPENVEVLCVTPSAGHLSSASIYPACLAPYCFVTACSDSSIRFWKTLSRSDCEADFFNSYKFLGHNGYDYKNVERIWSEWQMLNDSKIFIEGQILHISVAYSARFACAYKYGKSFTRPGKDDFESRYVNLCVAIYECESTGGTEWILEDTIHLKNINLPRFPIDHFLDFSYIRDSKYIEKKHRLNKVLNTLVEVERQTSNDYVQAYADNVTEINTTHELLAVPSFSTIESLKKSITEKGNICPLTQKHLVLLDWVSNEDGSHILTVACGSKILLYTPVSSDLAQANIKAMKESMSSNRPILRKASSLAQPLFVNDFRWMTLRKIEIDTADSLPGLPMQISWVRDGVFVVGLDSEMHIYSQWKSQSICNNKKHLSIFDDDNIKTARDIDLKTITKENQKKLGTISSSITRVNSINLQLLEKKSHLKETNVDYMPDFGLFEASRLACPVLPQYHPKQLIEFLNFGKIRSVKAILRHVVDCLIGTNNDLCLTEEIPSWNRSRTFSISNPNSNTPERRLSVNDILDYSEITNISPVPLYMLLEADKVCKSCNTNDKEYDKLFENSINLNQNRSDQKMIRTNETLTQFSLKDSQMLLTLLTHKHLPGLSSLDQMHLLALADTVANCHTDELSDKFRMQNKTITDPSEDSSTLTADNLDDCALRFLLAMKHYNYLIRYLPLTQRAQYQKNGIGPHNIVWAFHSETQEELLNFIPGFAKNHLSWLLLRELGVALWIRNSNLLKSCMLILAKSIFQQRNDPMEAALFYLAMNKKNILRGLYQNAKQDIKMTKFFSQNFDDELSRKSALKNAYALLSKQRFEHAVAFFLLGKSLKNAVEVCLNRLNDFHLAVVIIRLYEGDNSDTLKQLLYEQILGCDSSGEHQNFAKAHPDPFLRSMALWLLGRHEESLSTLLLGSNVVGSLHPSYDDETKEVKQADPNVFNFYIYLRTHPLLIFKQKTKFFEKNKKKSLNMSFEDEFDDKVFMSPLERQLYFTTAHSHFKAGCPALALEVLSKLPKNLVETLSTTTSAVSSPVYTNNVNWSQSDIDFRVKTDDLNLTCSDNDNDDENEDTDGDEENDVLKSNQLKQKTKNQSQIAESHKDMLLKKKSKELDIMAQQLKFVACLKILMEELSTLATGFEVDGGQLRYELYVWLEQEALALKEICSYTFDNFGHYGLSNSENDTGTLSKLPLLEDSDRKSSTLHEFIFKDAYNFEVKVKRALTRKQWLKENETLLRTLFSYCSLHGATGGLASVRMELVLLLQELHQDKVQQQLLSPLPFPKCLPLLAASIANNRTEMADPIRYLQSLNEDLLDSMIDLIDFSAITYDRLITIKDTSIALSACIYQSLCESDCIFENSSKKQINHLICYKTKYSIDENVPKIVTLPNKWPGVSSLRAFLCKEKEEDTPKLLMILCEAFAAVYLSLLLFGLSNCDFVILYHVVAHKFDSNVWGKLFGGGIRNHVKNSTKSSSVARNQSEDESSTSSTCVDNHRKVFNFKVLTRDQQNQKEEQSQYREQFLPPESSILVYLLKPPSDNLVYNLEEDVDEFDEENSNKQNDESVDPNSYTCLIIKLAVIRLAEIRMKEFLEVVGLDSTELPINSHLIHSALKRIEHWRNKLKNDLDEKIPPENYMPECQIEPVNVNDPIFKKYRKLLDQQNSPFAKKSYTESARRLWFYLVNQESIRDIFIRAIFQKRRNLNLLRNDNNDEFNEVVHIIHKDQESINAFSINEVNNGLITIATTREMQEVDITLLLNVPELLEDECEMDILNLSRDNSMDENSSFLLIQTHFDKILSLHSNNGVLADNNNIHHIDETNNTPPINQQTGRGVSVVKGLSFPGSNDPDFVRMVSSRSPSIIRPVMRHKVEGIRRMSSHPLLPIYLTGSQDGSVKLWEWGHESEISIPRVPGSYAKVMRVRFFNHGNKFGVADSDGNLSLYQVSLYPNSTRPYFTHQCHNKGVFDFAFMGSSSLIATAGFAISNKNVAIWDTLTPQQSVPLVMAFVCHDQGANCLVFAQQHQVLISCGKKGEINLFDTRNHELIREFQAHESSVRCIALEPHEEFFITGAADGDIKIWTLLSPTLLLKLPGEHARGSIFKNIGQGVTQLYLDIYCRLFSCGANGSMKVRQLPDRSILFSSTKESASTNKH